jgi:hypothetical protein
MTPTAAIDVFRRLRAAQLTPAHLPEEDRPVGPANAQIVAATECLCALSPELLEIEAERTRHIVAGGVLQRPKLAHCLSAAESFLWDAQDPHANECRPGSWPWTNETWVLLRPRSRRVAILKTAALLVAALELLPPQEPQDD